jgi:hypothetical protein
MVGLLKLGIDILVFVGKDFIFCLHIPKALRFFSWGISGNNFIVRLQKFLCAQFFSQSVDFPDYGSSIGRKWGKE